MLSPIFLTLENILDSHEDQLGLFGGGAGIRDQGLLESALAQPMATFDGRYLHPDLHSMAAAYLFHLVQNHPFIDGNKRIGLIAALTFLELNGIPTDAPHDELYDLTMAVAASRLSKEDLTTALRRLFPAP
jgi:death-on-curing protein